MTRLEDKLTAALYRATCPDATELGEYHLDLIPAARQAAIQQHLAHCPHCARELGLLRNYLAELTPELDYRVREKVKIWLARLITADAPPGVMPALALRGAGAARRGANDGPLVYEAGDAQLTIVVQDDPEHPGHKSLLGLVLGVETADLQAHLWQNAQLLATTAVDDLGNFALTRLQPGPYELILTGGGVEIHVQQLTV
jgi:hypothetical protein